MSWKCKLGFHERVSIRRTLITSGYTWEICLRCGRWRKYLTSLFGDWLEERGDSIGSLPIEIREAILRGI